MVIPNDNRCRTLSGTDHEGALLSEMTDHQVVDAIRMTNGVRTVTSTIAASVQDRATRMAQHRPHLRSLLVSLLHNAERERTVDVRIRTADKHEGIELLAGLLNTNCFHIVCHIAR